MTLATYRNKLSSASGKRSLLQKQMEDQTEFVIQKKEYLVALEQAQIFIQNVAKATQEKLCYHINDVVQLALDALFPDEYTFNLEFEVKNGKTVANLNFYKQGYLVDILKSDGGGVVDIASLALRIAAWSLSRTEPVLILDEPLQKIQPKELQAVAWAVVEELSKRLSLQFIIISNSTNNNDIGVKAKEFKVALYKKEIDGKEYKISGVEEV